MIRRLLGRMRRGGLGQPTSRGVKYADPLHAGRHPFQTYMLTLGIVSGLPILFGQVAAASIVASLPPWLAFAWGLSLFLGCIVALVGSYWFGDYDTALTLERIGLTVVGFAALGYGAVLVAFFGVRGGVPAGLAIGFGLACVRRAADIRYVIKQAIHTAQGQA